MALAGFGGDCHFGIAGVVEFVYSGVGVDLCAVILGCLDEAGVEMGAVNYPPSVYLSLYSQNLG